MRNKEVKTYRLSDDVLRYISAIATENGISNTAALEKIIREHERQCTDQGEQLANLVVKKIEDKYSNMFTRMRLATTMSDRNIQIVLEILNSMLIHLKIDTAYTSSMIKSNVWEESEKAVKEMIAKYKQYKDNKKKS